MGNEFFDGLSETITRTAKELSGRAENLYESQKVHNKLSGEERIVDKIMTDIGNLIYKRYSSGEETDTELAVLCEEIDQHMSKIAEYRDSMAELRGQKVCPSCHKDVDREATFCPYCGAACPTAEPEEEAGKTVEPEMNSEEAPETESEGNCACGSGNDSGETEPVMEENGGEAQENKADE